MNFVVLIGSQTLYLPPEIITIIGYFANTQTLKSLRLCSRACGEAIEPRIRRMMALQAVQLDRCLHCLACPTHFCPFLMSVFCQSSAESLEPVTSLRTTGTSTEDLAYVGGLWEAMKTMVRHIKHGFQFEYGHAAAVQTYRLPRYTFCI